MNIYYYNNTPFFITTSNSTSSNAHVVFINAKEQDEDDVDYVSTRRGFTYRIPTE